MKRLLLASLAATLFCQFSFAQQPSGNGVRVGDAFRGHIKSVRSERSQVRVVDGVEVEGSRMLFQAINYSEDGLGRETINYRGAAIQRNTVEAYLPSGDRDSTSVYGPDGTLISKVGYEYDLRGQLGTEVQYLADGSVKERRTIQSIDSPQRQVAIARTSGAGTTIETSINTSEYTTSTLPTGPSKRSVWTTTKADGSRTENIFEVDSSGTHNDQQVTYSAEGTLTWKRVSIVDAGINRLEATEYDGAGNINIRSLETREYDSHRNLIKMTNYTWNPTRQTFVPIAVSYNTIEYFK